MEFFENMEKKRECESKNLCLKKCKIFEKINERQTFGEKNGRNRVTPKRIK